MPSGRKVNVVNQAEHDPARAIDKKVLEKYDKIRF